MSTNKRTGYPAWFAENMRPRHDHGRLRQLSRQILASERALQLAVDPRRSVEGHCEEDNVRPSIDQIIAILSQSLLVELDQIRAAGIVEEIQAE
jgi:hypothetical protein